MNGGEAKERADIGAYSIGIMEMVMKRIQTFDPSKLIDDYNVDQLSWEVAKSIFSYVDFVNRKGWENMQESIETMKILVKNSKIHRLIIIRGSLK